MIPCYVCGKDIGGGWYIGYPPAPDSQKVGLCREHDLTSHRKRAQRAWQELMRKSLEDGVKNSAYKSGDIPQLLSIYFTGGGSISLPCSSFSIVDGKTLKIITPGGENIFFPLGQVRNYALSPLTRDEPQTPRQAGSADAGLEAEALARSASLPESIPKALLEPKPEPKPKEEDIKKDPPE